MAGAPGVKLRDVEGTGTGNVVSLRRRADYRFYLLDERRSESRRVGLLTVLMPWRWVLAINFIGARRPTFVAHKSVPFLQGVIRSGSISLMFVTDQHCRQRTIVAVGGGTMRSALA